MLSARKIGSQTDFGSWKNSIAQQLGCLPCTWLTQEHYHVWPKNQIILKSIKNFRGGEIVQRLRSLTIKTPFTLSNR